MNCILTKPYPLDINYLVQSNGYVFSLKTRNYVSTHLGSKGYHLIRVQTKNKIKSIPLGRMVLTAFDRLPITGEECHHIDNNKSNNDISNLKWITGLENIRLRDLEGFTAKGEKLSRANLTEEKVKHMRLLYSLGWTQRMLADKYSMDHGSVGRIVRREHWRHV